MADSEKAQHAPVIIQPPVYTASADRTSNKSTIVLSAYSAAVTALFLAALIFGGLMYQARTQECDSSLQVKTKDYEEDGEKMKEEVELDYTKEIEVIKLTKNDGRTNNGIVVLDFRRSLTAMYLPEEDKCYLIGGVGHNMKSPFGEQESDGMDDKGETTLKEADGYPVQDASILPEYLQSYCEGKEIRWMEKTTKSEMESSRQKRGVCLYRRCIYYYYWGRYYYYCYYFYGYC